MAISEFLEDLVSHLPALGLFQQMDHRPQALGYQYLTPAEALAFRGGKRGRVILETILTQQLQNLNKITFRGQTHEFSESNLRSAVDALSDIPFDGLVKTNEQVFDLLTLGKSLEQTIDGNKKSYSIQYIDWDRPERNVYHVADEFEVERTASHETRRPDIVLFVNGIPLAVVECKRPDLRDALDKGISQHLRNQRPDEIPHLFVYSQLLLAVCQNQGKFATAGTPKKYWAIWNEENPGDLDAELARLINTPLSPEQRDRLYEGRSPEVSAKMRELTSAGSRLPSPQDRLVYCLLRPERLLELAYRYTLFDKNIKKVARYQQYLRHRRDDGPSDESQGRREASRRRHLAYDRQRQEPHDGHARQGPGAGADHQESEGRHRHRSRGPRQPDMEDVPGVPQVGREGPQRRGSRELVSSGKADIITTIIDKFESAANTHGLRDEGSNVFVLVDESHRSQYGLGPRQDEAGVPERLFHRLHRHAAAEGREEHGARSSAGSSTPTRCGKAVEDKAVTPILYEGRMSILHGDQKAHRQVVRPDHQGPHRRAEGRSEAEVPA